LVIDFQGLWQIKLRRVEDRWMGFIVPRGELFMDKHNVAELKPEDVIWETKAIAIEGMTCDNCVKYVTKALRGVNGVKAVEVDRQNARATVTYDTTKTDIPALDDALKKSGYRARPFADPE
jgi:copper chaperone CopZ